MTFQYDSTALNGKLFFLPIKIIPDLKQLQLGKRTNGCEQLKNSLLLKATKLLFVSCFFFSKLKKNL